VGKVKIGIVSLGCAKNLTDTELMVGKLVQSGYEITNQENLADILIINTCGFIEKAKQESINTILELSQQKQIGNCKGLIITGCLSQRYKDQLIAEMPEIDGIIGTNEYHLIDQVVEKVLTGEKYEGDYSRDYLFSYNEPNYRLTPQHYAYLKVAEGCDNRCSFCVIPSIRGEYRSYPFDYLISKAEKMGKEGVKEINLIAQDTSRYGLDLYKSLQLPELIKRIAQISDLEWIRILYCYPTRITDELIQTIKNENKVCKYLDIPLQHCNDEILARMNRPINKQEIVNLIKKLREAIPNLVLRTSFIVGFPGETEEQFAELLDFMEKMRFERVGIFTYSQEEDTAAGNMAGQISEAVKQERYRKAMELQKRISFELNKEKLNKEYAVLVEGKLASKKYNYWGRSQDDAPEVDGRIFLKGKNITPGKIVKVKITGFDNYDLLGEMVENESGK